MSSSTTLGAARRRSWLNQMFRKMVKKPTFHIRAGAEAIDRPYGTRACFLDKILRLDTVTTENDRITVEPFRSLLDDLAEEEIFFRWKRHAIAKPLRSLPAGRLRVSDVRN